MNFVKYIEFPKEKEFDMDIILSNFDYYIKPKIFERKLPINKILACEISRKLSGLRCGYTIRDIDCFREILNFSKRILFYERERNVELKDLINEVDDFILDLRKLCKDNI